MRKHHQLAAILVTAASFAATSLLAQTTPPKPMVKTKPQTTTTKSTQSPKQKFALEVVRSAVAIPQSDPQDRLRVLVAASNVALPLQPALAKQFSKEGLQLEQEIIQSGRVPAASMMDTGAVDCRSVESLVENVTPEKVAAAEQTLIGAISRCKSTVPAAQRLESAALDNNISAPRLALSLMEAVGAKTAWSQEQFEKVFKSLPSDAKSVSQQAPNFATLYAQMAPQVDTDAARAAGLKLLDWLAKLDDQGPRNLAVNVTTGAMKDVLKDNYDKSLESDVIARQIAQTAGQPGEADLPPEENASVLAAMGNKGQDRTAELNNMPPSQRAREAAASGFADGTSGDKKLASRYFDVAFSALNDVWSNRSEGVDASAVVQEVSEAAAQVDPVNALQRAQHLSDPTAQAIGMIAVARVVSAEQGTTQSAKQ